MDIGSDTLGNYRYQVEVAAQICVALLTQGFVESVVCEWHEDFVVSYADGSVELVSVKHRGKRRNPWNVADLCKDGGLAHLFDRWRACDGLSNVRLRLATNAGLTTGKGGATTLKAMCGPDPRITSGVGDMARARIRTRHTTDPPRRRPPHRLRIRPLPILPTTQTAGGAHTTTTNQPKEPARTDRGVRS
ncbi:dsDNA nuclease domain-containing protein [Streptomyces sp. NPDC056544]|uniref:dsDNA nuclease domain-containing protein n=1 Tax=unclassified Streptomyces TaxID=2593676 RepID=UPI003686D6A5